MIWIQNILISLYFLFDKIALDYYINLNHVDSYEKTNIIDAKEYTSCIQKVLFGNILLFDAGI